mgnify:CR=1 FL=1
MTVMRESAHSLLRIIDDVLDFSKIEAGRLDVEAMPFSLRAIVEGTIGSDARAIGGASLPLLANFAVDRDVFLRNAG